MKWLTWPGKVETLSTVVLHGSGSVIGHPRSRGQLVRRVKGFQDRETGRLSKRDRHARDQLVSQTGHSSWSSRVMCHVSTDYQAITVANDGMIMPPEDIQDFLIEIAGQWGIRCTWEHGYYQLNFIRALKVC
ncbi:uncharacterized protein LOC143213335 isoform X1 [Lasioglossum baleicum]|uniref:uncharacterized protein LOC143213335 isoform X1 n=1 Tax=Lasioglossum baleicum TaxID=434251 RepID=UPI003FCD3547